MYSLIKFNYFINKFFSSKYFTKVVLNAATRYFDLNLLKAYLCNRYIDKFFNRILQTLPDSIIMYY